MRQKKGRRAPEGERAVLRVAAVTMLVNAALSAFKLFAGLAGRSSAMLSDAAHSASDALSTVAVMVGVRLAGRRPDERHPYGHERMECVAALGLAALLFATGLGIGGAACSRLWGRGGPPPVPGRLALAAAAVSIAVKEGMFRYARAAARRAGSDALMADAWHHRSDALSSVGSLAGIAGARLGFPLLDPAAGLAICALILKAAAGIARDAAGKLLDESCGEEMAEGIRRELLAVPGVLAVDDCKTRRFGARVYVDVEIAADGAQTLREAHEIAERAHERVEGAFPGVKHCMVHVNPAAG